MFISLTNFFYISILPFAFLVSPIFLYEEHQTKFHVALFLFVIYTAEKISFPIQILPTSFHLSSTECFRLSPQQFSNFLAGLAQQRHDPNEIIINALELLHMNMNLEMQ